MAHRRRTNLIAAPRPRTRPRPRYAHQVAIGIRPEARPRSTSTALHEAGHACVSIWTGTKVNRVAIGRQICPGNNEIVDGYCSIEPLDVADLLVRWEAVAVARMSIIYAGPIAENLLYQLDGRCVTDDIVPPYPDEVMLEEIVSLVICSGLTDDGKPLVYEENRERLAPMIASLHSQAAELASKLIHGRLDTVLAVATALLEKGTLTGDEVRTLVLGTGRPAPEGTG
jgi:ATP-dependent Zn protease